MKFLNQINNSENEYDFSHLLYYGDYACTNFLNTYGRESRILKTADYPSEWKEEFGISDCRLFFHKLIADGYLEPTSIESRLAEDSLEKIQKIAEEADLSASGTKEEILQRLELNTTRDQLAKYLPGAEIYSLSVKGKAYLADNQDLITLYQKKDRYHVSYNEYAALKSRDAQADFYAVLWQVMNERFQRNAEDTEYAAVQKEYLNMYVLFLDQDKKSDALNALLNYIFMDLNVFADTFAFIEQFRRSSLSVPEYLADAAVPVFQVRPDIIDDILQLKDSYDPKIARNISENNVSYYVNTEAFLAILDQVFAKALSIAELEEQINAKIPKALDYILRNQPAETSQAE